MPVLTNARRERFAREIAKGVPITKAYAKAGYKLNDGNAGKMYEKVKHRVIEITDSISERSGITIAQVVTELGKIGFANMLDYVTVGSDGLPFVDMSKVTRDQAAAIQEVHVETKTDSEINDEGEREAVPVRKVRFKLANKIDALEKIGKHLGMFIDRHEVSGTITLEALVGASLKPEPKVIEATAEEED